MLAYDSAVLYDTPDFAYDGDAISRIALTIKEAIYRELKFGPVLGGLASSVRLDLRNSPPLRVPEDYPCVVFRRVTESEDNRVNFFRSRCEFEVIGTRGDGDELERIAGLLADFFGGVARTVGAFASDGTPDPGGGLRLKGLHVSTVDASSPELAESAVVLPFLFTGVRGA